MRSQIQRLTLLVIVACLIPLSGCSCEATPQPSDKSKSKTDKKTPAPLLTERPAEGTVVEPGGRALQHLPSQTRFELPKGWTSGKPTNKGGVVFLRIADGNSTQKAEITWIPLAGTLPKAVVSRLIDLRKLHGEKNVTTPKSIKIGPKSGLRMDLKTVDKRGVTKHETIYYFAAIPKTRSRWRIGIRVTHAAAPDDAVGRMLVNRFRWSLKPNGP